MIQQRGFPRAWLALAASVALFAMGACSTDDSNSGDGGGGAGQSGGKGNQGGSSAGTGGRQTSSGGKSSGGPGGVPGAAGSGATSADGGSSSNGAGGGVVDGGESSDLPGCLPDGLKQDEEAIRIKVGASRISGVAPLVVFFDTKGTEATATERPFHELGYCWDFADDTGETYAPSGLARNEAFGPVAAHVFELPGTYWVTVGVRDAAGRAAAQRTKIVVEAPDDVFSGSATVCFSANGDFNDCPDGADHVAADNLDQVGKHVGAGKRLLLRRGETFANGTIEINTAGPGSIGAYGPNSAARPVVSLDGTAFSISGQPAHASDWRISDLEFRGTGADARVANVDGKLDNFLFQRLVATNIGRGVYAADSVINYQWDQGNTDQDVPDVLAIVDSEFSHVVGGSGHNIIFVAAHRLVVLGNRLEDSIEGEHILRATWVDRGVISHNYLGNAPAPRVLIKLHAPNFDEFGVGEGSYTERLVISDNSFDGVGGHDRDINVGPQNTSTDQRVRDVLFDRNVFYPGANQQALMLSASDITVRNNLFLLTETRRCVDIDRRGKEPSPERITILHNTCYSADSAGPQLARVAEGKDISAVNNLLLGPAKGEVGADGAGNVQVVDSGYKLPTPGPRTDLQPFVPAPADGKAEAGTATYWDLLLMDRPSKAADVGAFEGN